jgi:hypothetical protein
MAGIEGHRRPYTGPRVLTPLEAARQALRRDLDGIARFLRTLPRTADTREEGPS